MQIEIFLAHYAEDILLARERYFPATIADMYNPTKMDTDFPLVREAHDSRAHLHRSPLQKRHRASGETI
jgi:hypothetical protein